MANNWNPSKDMPNLEGKVVVVTGANSGIGFETVKHLISKDAKVYFTVRSEEKAKKAVAEQLRRNPKVQPDNLQWVLMELEDVESVTKATEAIRSREDKIDILITNAGCMSGEGEFTEYGWEKAMAICYLGHFVFVNGLLPLLKKAATHPGSDVRVVTISSNAQHVIVPANFPLDFSTPSLLYGKLPYQPWIYKYVTRKFVFNLNFLNYGVARIATSMFARELQSIMDQQGVPIISISVNPGGALTEDITKAFKRYIWPLISGGFVSADEASFNSLFAATAKQVRENPETYKGNYLEPVGSVHPGHLLLNNDKQVKSLWKTTESELNTYLAKRNQPPLQPW